MKHDSRLLDSKIALLGCSEGTIIASMVADRKIVTIDGLLLFGYANDNLFDIIKWQYSGKASMINLRKYFDTNKEITQLANLQHNTQLFNTSHDKQSQTTKQTT